MTTGGQSQIGNVDLVKQLNSAAVYRLIDQQGPISRIQIAELSQLAPASVTKITRQLIERGLIKEVDQQASTGGRRAISIITETRPLFEGAKIKLKSWHEGLEVGGGEFIGSFQQAADDGGVNFAGEGFHWRRRWRRSQTATGG